MTRRCAVGLLEYFAGPIEDTQHLLVPSIVIYEVNEVFTQATATLLTLFAA